MTDATYTHLSMLLDRSGSMQAIRTDVEGAFNSLVADQRKEPGRATLTLAQFNDEYEIVHNAIPLDQVKPLVIRPSSTTALLDSIARIITDTGAALAAMPEDERPGTVIVAIMTDGLENASREMTHTAIKSIIERQEREFDWQFLYLGAGQDAIEVGAGLGIRSDRSLTYAATSSAVAVNATSGMVSALRSAAPAQRGSVGYSDAQRSASVGN